MNTGWPSNWLPSLNTDDRDDGDEQKFEIEDDQYLVTQKQRDDLKEQWDLLCRYVEQFSGQKLSEGDLKVNLFKKINFTIKKLLDEVIAMDEHIKYLEGNKTQGHPLYPSDPYNNRGGNF